MSYTALYRKFRPQTFDEVKGQDAIVTTLKNQLKSGRVAHAYLFCGTRGTGKTSIAKIFAKAVNCEHPNENGPCCECEMCRAADAGISANVIEIDAASNNSVDNIRNIREEVTYRPTSGRYKVYIIDEAHMLSTGAFNALLKTLEEPPEYVIFILATTEAAKIPVTILSRCQRYDFKRISTDEISDRLTDLLGRENVEAESAGIKYLAKRADGSMRDALSLLDQCISCYVGEKLTYEKILKILGAADIAEFGNLFEAVKERDVVRCITVLDDLAMKGKEMSQLASDFTWYLRNLLIAKRTDAASGLLEVSEEDIGNLKKQAEGVEDDTLIRYIREFAALTGVLRSSPAKRTEVEMALIRLCRPDTQEDILSLKERIRVLEEKIENGSLIAYNVQQSMPAKEEEFQKEELYETAAPEDLLKIKQNWAKIKSKFGSLMGTLLDESVPSFDPKSSENLLYLRVPSENTAMMIKKSTDYEELCTEINRYVGKKVEVRVIGSVESKKSGIKEIKLAQVVQNAVNMHVEIED